MKSAKFRSARRSALVRSAPRRGQLTIREAVKVLSLNRERDFEAGPRAVETCTGASRARGT